MFSAFASNALANTNGAEPAKGGFYTNEQLTFRPNRIENALASTRRIQNTEEDSCSSVIISNSGYLITNIHCMLKCNELALENPAESGTRAFDSEKFKGIFNGIKIVDQQKYVDFCNSHRSLNTIPYYVEPDIVGDLEMVWVGRGRANTKEEMLAPLSITEAELAPFKNALNDYVILKAKPQDGKKLNCLKPGPLPPVNAWTWVIGFPAWNQRENGHGSNGAGQFISFGTVRSSVAGDVSLSSLAEHLGPAEKENFWRNSRFIYDRKDWLRTDADAFGNNSGGAIIDNNGQFVALLFSITKSTFEGYYGATVFGISPLTIRSEIEHSLGKQKAAEIFDCQSSDDSP
jgi:S1-C subfamily serine protease